MQRATIAGCVCLLCAVCARAQQPESSATIITFDAPGASRAPYQGTFATSINGAGIIAGYYIDANAVSHGFVRASDGAMTTFDAPEAGTGAGQGTFALSINAAGAIAGYYITAQNVARALIRTIGGTFTTFAAPGPAPRPIEEHSPWRSTTEARWWAITRTRAGITTVSCLPVQWRVLMRREPVR